MNTRLRELYRRKKFSITQLALILVKLRSSIGEWLANERKILLSIENVENNRIFLNKLSQKYENESKIKAIQNIHAANRTRKAERVSIAGEKFRL